MVGSGVVYYINDRPGLNKQYFHDKQELRFLLEQALAFFNTIFDSIFRKLSKSRGVGV